MVTKPPLLSSDLHLRVRQTPYTPTLPHLLWFSSAGPTSGNRVHQLFSPFSKSLTLLIQPQCMDIICCNTESKQRVSLEEDSALFQFFVFSSAIKFWMYPNTNAREGDADSGLMCHQDRLKSSQLLFPAIKKTEQMHTMQPSPGADL